MLRLWLAMGVGAVLVISSGVISSIVRAQPTADPVAVVTAYELARNRQDIEGALAYFADNAMVTQRNTTFSGKDEIRNYLSSVVTRSRFIVVSDRRASGNVVTWTERSSTQLGQTSRLPGYTGGTATGGSTPNPPSPAGRPGANQAPGSANTAQTGGFAVTVEAVVQDGKIQSMSYVFGGPSPRNDPSLQGRAELPASIGLAAVALVLVGVLLVASIGLGHATRANSSLRGRLLQDLQGWAAARQ
jgi:hypothetical protein